MSDRLIVSGATPILSGPEVTEQKTGGTDTRYTWKGSRAECIAQRDLIRGTANTIELRPAGDGTWELIATYAGQPEDEGGPDAELPVNLHELEISAEIVSVWQSTQLSTHFTAGALRIMSTVAKLYEDGSYSSMDGQYIKDLIDNGGLTLTTWNSQTTQARALLDLVRLLTAASLSGEATDAQAFFNTVIFVGTDKAYKYNPTYRRSVTSASFVQVQASFVGVGQIWTSGEVESFEGIPNGEWFGLPSTLWLKLPPRVSAAAGGKTAIEYSYQGGFDTASQFLYTAYGSATLI
jgi:hypothetical protein